MHPLGIRVPKVFAKVDGVTINYKKRRGHLTSKSFLAEFLNRLAPFISIQNVLSECRIRMNVQPEINVDGELNIDIRK